MCKFWSPFWVQLSIVLCLQSTEQKSCPSLSKNCWLMRLPPHPLQLKQWGQACQWKSPCESPGESAVMVLLHVLQDLENMKKKNHKNEEKSRTYIVYLICKHLVQLLLNNAQ